ncbi:MAG TPA: 2-oxoacid:acceptor oxidoreductase family protein [Candidatus Cloacimonadota bacterium]|nr:2-oxoacid:acceptor oxidoreductase family protein [Candidatus Cloacimonadota bacterium]
MKSEMVFSGFGGQGALTIGKFIAQSAMTEGKNVSWLPSYGPEMRGGTANVATVVSDSPIASPLVSFPDILVALNQPSLDKFAPDVKKGGIVIVNSDMCPEINKIDGLTYYVVPMNQISSEIGDVKVLNMIPIGIIIGKTQTIKFETIEAYLTKAMKEKNPALLEKNLKAIQEGIKIATEA